MPDEIRRLLLRFGRPEDRDAFLRQVRVMDRTAVGILALRPGRLVEAWVSGPTLDRVRALVVRDHGEFLSES